MASHYQKTFTNYLYLQRVAPSTMEAYLRCVREVSSFHNQSADTLDNDQIQDYLLYCIQEKKLAWSSCNVLFSGLKKYYQGYLGRNNSKFSIPPRTRGKKLPMLLSQPEVLQLLEAPASLKHRALLATVYSSGLRVSEVVKIRPEHIESDNLRLKVEQGKGRKDRYTIMSSVCLETLREYWRAYQPGEWLFFGKDKSLPMPINTAQRIFYNAKKKARIEKGRGIHTLRHCFASHLLENGTEIYAIKKWMGHSSIKTTYGYIQLSADYLSKTQSPLDRLYSGETS
ncbi:MAG: tyrosine-type recombinase/integrase [Desulfobulbaceae bacterium]|nr:tyrosine-type recombinase/integrase [Desulfobulbaceae bacterium]